MVVPENVLKQVMSINMGFRPSLDFSKYSGTTRSVKSSVGEPNVIQSKSENDYPAWYDHGDLPGDRGYIWDKFPIGSAPHAPLGKGTDAQDRVANNWENYYFYLREAIGGGGTDDRDVYMRVEPGKASENLARFLESKDEGLREMGEAMARGYAADDIKLVEKWKPIPRLPSGVEDPTKAGTGKPAQKWRAGRYLAGRPKTVKARIAAGIGADNERGIKIKGWRGGSWLQYPTQVATTTWMKDGPQLTFDTMRRTSTGPIENILGYFLERIMQTADKDDKATIGELKSGLDAEVSEQDRIKDVSGSTYEEKLVDVLGLGVVPEDLRAPSAGHRIDIKFKKDMKASDFGAEVGGGTQKQKPLTFTQADVTSSYFDEGGHHGIGSFTGRGKGRSVKGRAGEPGSLAGYLGRDGVFDVPEDLNYLKAHFDDRIDTFNYILKLVYGEVGKVTTRSDFRTPEAQQAASDADKFAVTSEKGTMKNVRRMLVEAAKGPEAAEKNLERVADLILKLDKNNALKESGKALLKTVEWVLHHLGDALVSSTYANIMPIRLDSYDGTLIVIYYVKADGFYSKIEGGKSQLYVIDNGIPMGLLKAAEGANTKGAHREQLQAAQRAFAAVGFRSIRGGQAIMNQINIHTKKGYRVSYMVPIDDDIKDVLWSEFAKLTMKIAPGGKGRAFQTDIKNQIKKEANRYSTDLRTFMTARLKYSTEAAMAWLSPAHGKPLPIGATKVRNLWALPYFTMSAAPGQKGGAVQAMGRWVDTIKGREPQWVTWTKGGEAERLT